MKKLLILLICFLFAQPTFAVEVYKKLDLMNGNSNSRASKILYNYVLQEQKMTPDEIKEFANIVPESVQAYEIDLNDDGVNEIVGIVYSTLYQGSAGYSLIILQKQQDRYKDIAFVNFEPLKPVYVLSSKTDNFRDIKLYGSVAYNFKPLIVKMINGVYQSRIISKDFIDALKQ